MKHLMRPARTLIFPLFVALLVGACDSDSDEGTSSSGGTTAADAGKASECEKFSDCPNNGCCVFESGGNKCMDLQAAVASGALYSCPQQ